jgi:hypothetical protein
MSTLFIPSNASLAAAISPMIQITAEQISNASPAGRGILTSLPTPSSSGMVVVDDVNSANTIEGLHGSYGPPANFMQLSHGLVVFLS